MSFISYYIRGATTGDVNSEVCENIVAWQWQDNATIRDVPEKVEKTISPSSPTDSKPPG